MEKSDHLSILTETIATHARKLAHEEWDKEYRSVLSQLLTHPSHGVLKEYVAEVDGGTPAPGALRALRRGVELDDGFTAPAEVGVLGPGVLRLTIHEGRNRQVRRMCDAVGHPVRRLVRTRIGPLRDTGLAPGRWRVLTPAEVRALAGAANDSTGTRA